ncbi:MAG: TIGR04255 family protein [Cyanobacteria bacterium 13_1_40CM_2_61_4]|nr:MAG: TIGR04255 family protein [Cyanobacteria bacterium 13_1_40CM_2_61_4]
MGRKKIKITKRHPLLTNKETSQRHYSRAPLTEALIDIRVELPGEVTLGNLSKVHVGQEKDYPRREETIIVHGKMSVGAEVGASATQTANGYRFVSKDERQIFQARLNGFTFNRLAPYERWESFRDEARRLWSIYRSIAAPKNITRIAVRYINRLDLPLPLKDFKDYLRTVPEISPKMKQGLSGYFMQLQIPQEDLGAMLILNQTPIPPPAPNVVSVVLDIDLFCEGNVPSEEQQIWDRFEQLRMRKNEIFEACITDRIRRMIA